MKIEMPTAAISGKFRMVVSKDAEMRDVTHDTGEFNNLITDVGMNRIGQLNVKGFENLCGRFVVGAGSAPPVFTDTALQAPVAFAASNPITDSESSNYERGYCEIVVLHQFGKGAAAGNLSEIGIQHTSVSGPLWSRALILDAAGNPTTITVLPDDFLTCYYTLRINIPQTDAVFESSVIKDGVPTPTTITVRPLNTENVSARASWVLKSGTLDRTFYYNILAFSGGLATPQSSEPLGARVGTFEDNNAVAVPYVNNSFQKYIKKTQGINYYNGTFSTLLIPFLMGCWQVNFNPPITKDNTQSIEWQFGYSWARA